MAYGSSLTANHYSTNDHHSNVRINKHRLPWLPSPLRVVKGELENIDKNKARQTYRPKSEWEKFEQKNPGRLNSKKPGSGTNSCP